MKNSSYYIGMFSLIGYCISSAFSEVLISNILVGLNFFSVCFGTFTIGVFVFIGFNFRNIKKLYLKAKQSLKIVVYLNITTFGSWFFLIYPLKYLEPSFVSTITFGAGPLIDLILRKFFLNSKNRIFDYIISIIIFSILCYMIFISILLSINKHKIVEHISAISCCFIVAISMIINRYNTKNLINNEFSALDILSLRFILLILITGILAFLNDNTTLKLLMDIRIIIASLGFVIIPLYLMQISQKLLDLFTIAFIAPLMPIIIYFFEFEYSIRPVSKELLYPMIGILLAILMGTYERYLRK